MDCLKARELINAYLDEELSEVETRHVDAHITECESCRHELEAYRQTRDIMRMFGRVDSPPNMAENIRIVMEKERLIPRRSKTRTLFAVPRMPNLGRLALAASFLIAILGGGSFYAYDYFTDVARNLATQKAQHTQQLAERQAPAAANANSFAKQLKSETAAREESEEEPEDITLSADLDAEPPARESVPEPEPARSIAGGGARNADQPTAMAALSLGAGGNNDGYAGRAVPAPRAAAPSHKRARAYEVDSLDLLVDEEAGDAGAMGSGPGSLPSAHTSNLSPAATAGAMAADSKLARPEGEKSTLALADMTWARAEAPEPSHARGLAAKSDTASKTATSTSASRTKESKKDADKKKAKPALNIILKASSGQPAMQQQAVLNQLQTQIESGQAKVKDGKIVLNMPADETLKLLNAMNADPAQVGKVPVPEKMLKNEIKDKQPRLVTTEIIFVADEAPAKPAEAAPAADKSDDSSD